jgi:hypothetical protein
MFPGVNKEQVGVEREISSDQSLLEEQKDSSLPLSVALPQLPYQYFDALIKPSVATFSKEKNSASWGLVCIQLLTWAILDAALGLLVNLISPPATSSPFLQVLSLATSVGLVVVVPLLFFLLMGIVYLFARVLGGQGTFLEQCNTSLSIQLPLGILSKILALIPVVGRLLNSFLSLYGIVLQVFVIMAVHRLSRGRAIVALLLPVVGIVVLTGAIFLIIRK